MENVFIVYYDNGQRWEDHSVMVHKIFSSQESATKYAEEKNTLIQTFKPSVSEEKYKADNWAEDTGCTYEDFVQNEEYDWSMTREATFYVSKEQVYDTWSEAPDLATLADQEQEMKYLGD